MFLRIVIAFAIMCSLANMGYSQDVTQLQLLVEHNNYRAAQGLQPLTLDGTLTAVAQVRAVYNAKNNNRDHNADGGYVAKMTAAGYTWSGAAENFHYSVPDPKTAVAGWVASAGHRANIVGNYADVGFGYARSSSGVMCWVAVFGKRRGPAPVPPVTIPVPLPLPPLSATVVRPSPVIQPVTPTAPRFRVIWRR